MMNYKEEELFSIVGKLGEMYYSNESSSISYNMGKQFMGAVLYSLREWEEEMEDKNNGKSLFVKKHSDYLSTYEMYEEGQKLLFEKVKNTQCEYNAMMENFQDYGNCSLYDTVVKALPGFFKYYDIRFFPQNTIITLDYPILFPVNTLEGIRAISKYINCIKMEQKFLAKFEKQEVIEFLNEYHKEYSQLFVNIVSVVLRGMIRPKIMEQKEIIEKNRGLKWKNMIKEQVITKMDQELVLTEEFKYYINRGLIDIITMVEVELFP